MASSLRTLKCPLCGCRLETSLGDGESLQCPSCEGVFAVADEHVQASASNLKEGFFKLLIPIGYAIFLIVPLAGIIYYVSTQQPQKDETAQAKSDKKHVVPDPPRTDDTRPPAKKVLVPKPKIDTRPVPDPGTGATPPRAVPLDTLSPPRDLTAELEAAFTASKDPDVAIRRRAATALGAFLGKQDGVLRLQAAERLAEMGLEAQPAASALRDATKDPDKDVRRFARQAIVKLDEVTNARRVQEFAPLVLELKAKEPENRVKTLRKIAALGAEASVASGAVIEAMWDKEKVVQEAADETLKKVNPLIYPYVVTLMEGTPDQRCRVLIVLVELGPEAECVVPLLLSCNDNPKLWGKESHFDLFPSVAEIAPKNRQFAAAVLGCIAAPNPNRFQSLRDRRLAGLAQLDVISATVEEKVAALHAATGDSHTVAKVFEAIGTLAPKDKKFAATVLAAVATPHLDYPDAPKVGRLAGIAQLEVIQATVDEKADALVVAMSDNATVFEVFAALGKIAPKDKRFVAAVLAAVAAPNPDRFQTVRDRRLAGLAQLDVIGVSTAKKVDALIDALKDTGTLPVVIKALSEYGAEAKFALPALKELKASTNEAVRSAAITAIAKIEAAIAEK